MSLTDRLACYKFNRLHLHLTDDQGWRIEIKRYPLLTRRGAWRTPNKHDSVCLRRAADERDPKFLLPEKNIRREQGKIRYGGYYTQDDIREIVAYAAQRGIEVIPEIDLPGHSLAGHRLLSAAGVRRPRRLGQTLFDTALHRPRQHDRLLQKRADRAVRSLSVAIRTYRRRRSSLRNQGMGNRPTCTSTIETRRVTNCKGTAGMVHP